MDGKTLAKVIPFPGARSVEAERRQTHNAALLSDSFETPLSAAKRTALETEYLSYEREFQDRPARRYVGGILLTLLVPACALGFLGIFFVVTDGLQKKIQAAISDSLQVSSFPAEDADGGPFPGRTILRDMRPKAATDDTREGN